MKNIALSKIYTVIILIAPILNVYGLSQTFNTFSLREVAYIILFLIIVISNYINKIRINRAEIYGLLFIFSTMLSLFVAVLFSFGSVSVFRVMRFVLLNLTVLLFARELFYIEYAVKIFKTVAIIATVFLFMQILSNEFFSKYLPGHLQSLPIRQRGLYESTQAIINQSVLNSSIRYSSFFEEPAYYASYVCVFLSVYLWKCKKINPLIVILLSLGVLLSTSILGVAALAFVFALYLFKIDILFQKRLLNIKSRSVSLSIGLLMGLVIILVFASKMDKFQLLLTRINNGLAANARFIGYKMYFDSLRDMNPLTFLFGNSMSEQTLIIVSGYVVIPYYFGLVGYIVFIVFLVALVKKARKNGLIATALLLLFLNIGSSEFAAGMMFMIITSFILAEETSKGLAKE